MSALVLIHPHLDWAVVCRQKSLKRTCDGDKHHVIDVKDLVSFHTKCDKYKW